MRAACCCFSVVNALWRAAAACCHAERDAFAGTGVIIGADPRPCGTGAVVCDTGAADERVNALGGVGGVETSVNSVGDIGVDGVGVCTRVYSGILWSSL